MSRRRPRDYPGPALLIMELGTSAKSLSIVPLAETSAGGSAQLQQLVEELPLGLQAGSTGLAVIPGNQDQTSSAKTSRSAGAWTILTAGVDNNKSPSRKSSDIKYSTSSQLQRRCARAGLAARTTPVKRTSRRWPNLTGQARPSF